jgi:hypothetical protein
VSEANGALTPGDRIEHDRFGRGRVLGGSDGSSDQILSIQFDRETEPRSIIASYAGMRAITAWDEGRISPPWSEIEDRDRFVPPLVPGERELARFLDEQLDPAWRIYVRPHLDADRPIIAAVHPERGAVVWDVVPWKLEEALVEDGTWVVLVDGRAARFMSPIAQLDRVRAKLYGTYLPHLGERIDDGSLRFSLVRAGLFFTDATTARVRELVGAEADRKAIAVFGRDAFVADRLHAVIGVSRERMMEPGWFEAFDLVLGHAHRQVDALAAIRLTKAQERLAQPAPGVRVIDGVAGSGKSTVLAYRAVRLAASGRRVLILTFNRTLTNYLRALVDRVPIRWQRERVSVMHFHELIRLVHAHHGLRPPPAVAIEDEADGEPTEALERVWPAAALGLLEDLGIPPALRFDAVMVDEGQDFSESYAAVIQRLLPADIGELVIAHDQAQRVYGRRPVLTESSHPWSQVPPTPLRQGVRLAAGAAAAASRFAELWSLGTHRIETRDQGLLPDAEGPFLVPASDMADAAARALAVLEGWRGEPGHLPGRVAVLVPSRDFGIAFVRLLAEAGISTNHVFPVRRTGAMLEAPIESDERDWLIERTQKNAFLVGDARLKVSTIHSFKGWDAERVIFITPAARRDGDQRTAATIYVGMTRSEGDAVFVAEPGVYGLDDLGLPELAVTPAPAAARRFDELLAHARERQSRRQVRATAR